MSERITIKSQREIELMRAAGAVVRDTLLLLEKSAAIGMTTEELNKIAEDFIRSQGAIPSFLNYEGYPKSICTSVNEQVVHGIPGGYKLKDGDIISGYPDRDNHLIDATRYALERVYRRYGSKA